MPTVNFMPTEWPVDPATAIPTISRPLASQVTVEIGIIGGGIHGAALARELTLRGVSAALIDIGDFGGGTSQWSSQLLHGGIRYLQTGDIAQMREGLRERATWVRIAPWRCRWEAFWMMHRHVWQGMAHRVGIGLYDWWGQPRPNWPAELRLGRVPRRVFRADPRAAAAPRFRGAVAYADLMTWDRDLVRDLAASSDALPYEFHHIARFETAPDTAKNGHSTVRTAILRDRRKGEDRAVTATKWVFALGPWLDEALYEWFGETRKRLTLSTGIHFWFDPIAGCERPMAITYGRNRILFLIPRDEGLQVGTTERAVETGFAPVTDADREQLFAALETNLPGLKWREMPIRREESGVRPLVRADGDTTKLSRGAKLERFARFDNAWLVIGGKLTTARSLMAQLATEITGCDCPASATTPLRRWTDE